MVYSPNLWVDGQSWIPWGTLQQFSFWLVIPNWSGTCERIQLSNYLRLTRTYSKPQRDWNSSIFALFCRGFTFFSRSVDVWNHDTLPAASKKQSLDLRQIPEKRIAAMISWIWICVERIVCPLCPMFDGQNGHQIHRQHDMTSGFPSCGSFWLWQAPGIELVDWIRHLVGATVQQVETSLNTSTWTWWNSIKSDSTCYETVFF